MHRPVAVAGKRKPGLRLRPGIPGRAGGEELPTVRLPAVAANGEELPRAALPPAPRSRREKAAHPRRAPVLRLAARKKLV